MSSYINDKIIGINLKPEYYNNLLDNDEDSNIEWVEIHSENYFGDSIHHIYLEKIVPKYPLSLHSVGLNLGSCDDISIYHLEKLKYLVEKYNPIFISEHLSWGAINHQMVHDLLPLPLNKESLDVIKKNIDQTQNFLKREMLIENPSTYLEFNNSTMTEYEFLNELSYQTGCGILLDLNNLYVNNFNHGIDPYEYLNILNLNAIKEIHLAGHSDKVIDNHKIKIDTHSTNVCDEVWQLYQYFIENKKIVPTIIEWDNNIPTFAEINKEVTKAQNIMKSSIMEYS